MKCLFVVLLAVAAVAVSSCGGGGGGGGVDSSACNAVKIAGGDLCEPVPNVALVLVGDKSGNYLGSCTGSYISLTAVLTAAHCFGGGAGSVSIVSLGYLQNGGRVHIHPLYDGTTGSAFDMAIVQVGTPLNTPPLPLVMSRIPDVGEEVVAFGYGLDERGDEAKDRVQEGSLPLKATTTSYAGYYQGSVAIISTGEGSTCPGDSGGPVLAKGSNGEYGIVGITRAGPLGCGAEEGRPSVLSSTQSEGAIDFITSVVPDAATN